MALPKYIVIQSSTIEGLQEKVNERISDRYLIHGDLKMVTHEGTSISYAQPMVRGYLTTNFQPELLKE